MGKYLIDITAGKATVIPLKICLEDGTEVGRCELCFEPCEGGLIVVYPEIDKALEGFVKGITGMIGYIQ